MKNKILTISIIFILISLVFVNNNVFATYDFNYNGSDVSLPDLPFDITEHPDFIFGYSTNFSTHFYVIGYPTSEYEKVFLDNSSNNAIAYYKTGTTTLGQWTYWEIAVGSGNDWAKRSTQGGLFKFGGSGTIITSGVDIYSNNSYTEIFFQKTPAPPTTLAGVLEATNPLEMWKTLMKNVLVSLVVFLVVLIAFLKAWAWLKNQLRKA